MKKLLVVLALAFIGFTANAQIYAGGGIHFGTNQTVNADGDPAALIQIYPEVGYMFNDKMAAGISVGFSNEWGNTWIDINPYFRYFLADMGPVSFFVDGQLAISIVSGGGASQTNFGVGVAPGFSIPVSDNLSFVGHIGRLGYYGGSFEIDFTPANIAVGMYYSF